MNDYYEPVRNCLEVGRNLRFCAGAEQAAAKIKELQDRLGALLQWLSDVGYSEAEVQEQIGKYLVVEKLAQKSHECPMCETPISESEDCPKCRYPQ